MDDVKARATDIDPDRTTGSSSSLGGIEPPLGTLSDLALVNAIVDRQEGALAEAYERHGSAVSVLATRLCPEEAEAVTRETFLALWHAPEAVNLRAGSLRASLLAMAHGRSVAISRARSTHEAPEAILSIADLEQRVLQPWATEGVLGVLSELSDFQRNVITLAYFGTYTCRQIAALFDQPEETVRDAIRVGLRQLRATARGPDPQG
ncbi:MAG TPA: sigma factor-like helix-turn-helix DNA-binding protein [Acidimicrobiales bacterium]|nr:sigma factor-like helix-turn-helix DNA-binding protein [Acidimicrobiales bacterium]